MQGIDDEGCREAFGATRRKRLQTVVVSLLFKPQKAERVLIVPRLAQVEHGNELWISFFSFLNMFSHLHLHE